MEVYEKKEFLTNDSEYVILSIEEVLNRLNELNINYISVDDGDIFKIGDGRAVKLLHNDYDNPIVLKRDAIFNENTLYINPDWYLKNQELCQNLIKNICLNIESDSLSLSESFMITSEIIDALCKNKTLSEVSLARYSKNPYSLSETDYLKFKNSNIKSVGTGKVDKELEETFDSLIDFNNRSLISYYNYHDLQKKEKLYIDKKLTDEEIFNFKYISNSTKIVFNGDDYNNVILITNRLSELGKNNRVVLELNDKENFNRFILNHDINYSNLYIKLGTSEYPIKDYLKFEKRLYDMVKEAKDLSPFEQYVFVYNVTKKFKKYKENEDDKSQARNLYEILINDYMVCVGFSEMFGDLLNKLNIENNDLSVGVDVSYDKVDTKQENFEEVKSVEYGGHARRYVHIVDKKYGIDGFFIADPTWDNDLERDLYNNMAMTNEEVLNARRYIFSSKHGANELFFVNSVDEFIEKINFLLNRVNVKNDLNYLMRDLIFNNLEILDKNYVNFLKNKYSFLNESYYSWPNNITDLVYEVGNYIVEHVNKQIPGEVIMEAVRSVYKNAYGYEDVDLDSKMDEIIEINKKRQELSFPVRYRISSDGTKEIVMNSQNKFDFENSGRSR